MGAHGDALRRRGEGRATRARHTHPRAHGVDPPARPRAAWAGVVDLPRLARTGRTQRVGQPADRGAGAYRDLTRGGRGGVELCAGVPKGRLPADWPGRWSTWTWRI